MKYFDDIEVGYRSLVGTYTLERTEMIEFARQWDPQPFHLDENAAKASIFGGLVASSAYLFAICTRLFFEHKDQIQILAMLGKDTIRLPNPAKVDETLSYWTECIKHTPSARKNDRGVIVLADTVENAQGEPVLTQEVTLLLMRKN